MPAATKFTCAAWAWRITWLASGQGFFVRTMLVVTLGTLVINYTARLATYASPTFQRSTTETRPLVQLDPVNPVNQQRDAVYVYSEAGASAGFDSGFDAYKLPSGDVPSVAVTALGQDLAISGLSVPGPADVLLPLTVAVPTTSPYTLEAARVINCRPVK